MRFSYAKNAAFMAAAAVALTACVDENYDLSNIDTTTRLQVNDLTIPLNLSEIDLQSIIDVDTLNENSAIKIMKINGQRVYAVEKSGEFESEPVNIPKITAPAPEIDDIHQLMNMTSNSKQQLRRKQPASQVTHVDYEIRHQTQQFTFELGENDAIDSSVKTVKDIEFDKKKPLVVDINFQTPTLNSTISHIGVQDLVLIMPPGSKATYGDKVSDANGELIIPNLSNLDKEINLKVEIDDLKLKDSSTGSNTGLEVKDGKINYTSEIGFESGTLLVYPSDGEDAAMMPDNVNLIGTFTMSEVEVNKFNGEIDYPVEMDKIPDVDLGDLPDFLAGDQTNVIISNPQLYLEANNPVGQYNLEAETGITITAMRDNSAPAPQSLEKFVIGREGDTSMNILLCPDPTATNEINPAFAGAVPQKFTGMSKLLSGAGLPKALDINLGPTVLRPGVKKPHIAGNARNFPLQEDIPAVKGKYTFFTPFALADGSTIIYTKTQDGWNDEDVDKIEITHLKIAATANTTVPCGVKLVVHPVDKYGNVMNNISGEAHLPANATDHEFFIELTGDIRHLDGIQYVATATDFDGHALAPEQTIRLAKIRVTVSGSYTTEF